MASNSNGNEGKWNAPLGDEWEKKYEIKCKDMGHCTHSDPPEVSGGVLLKVSFD